MKRLRECSIIHEPPFIHFQRLFIIGYIDMVAINRQVMKSSGGYLSYFPLFEGLCLDCCVYLYPDIAVHMELAN